MIEIAIKKIKELWNKGAFHIIIANFLTKFVAFFGSIFLVRVLSKSSYGLLGYVENIYGYMHIFIGMGLGNALLRYVILGKTPREKFGYYKYSLTTGTKFNLAIILVFFIGTLLYPHPEDFHTAKVYIPIMLIAFPFQFLVESNQLTYRAMLNNKVFAKTSFFFSFSVILGRYLGALISSVEGVIASKLIINGLWGILLSYLTYRLYFKNVKEISIGTKEKKELNWYSIQYMITNGIWAVFMLNDIFLLGRIVGDPAVVADYKVAYVLPGNLSIISTAIGIFIGPYFVKNETDTKWVWKNYKKVVLVIASVIIPIIFLIFIFSRQIITLLYGVDYINIVPLMNLLLISALLNTTFRYSTAHILSSMGQVKFNMIISGLGVIFQIILNIILIPIYGVYGAALSSIIIYFLMSLSLVFIFMKIYRK